MIQMPASTTSTAAIPSSAARNLTVRAVLPWALLALLLSNGPYLLAWLAAPEGQRFSGILANHNDFTAYIAAMRQGAAGQWLFHFNFSPNVWQPQLMLPAYILAGKVLGIFNANNFLWFNLLRVAALIFTMGAFLVWVRRIFPGRVTTQRVAWLFLTLGGGLGWLLWPLTASWASATSYFPDLSRPEWTTLFTQLGLAKVWLDRCQEKLAAIHAAASSQYGQPGQQNLDAMDACRQRAHYHLQEARFWMERQYAWVMPMER